MGLDGWRGRIGFLYPSSGMRDYEFLRLLPEGVTGHFTRVPYNSGSDWADYEALADVGRLTAAASLVGQVGLSAITWADTSASFIKGLEFARAQADAIADAAGAPASSTSLAILEACRSLGIHSLSVVGMYPARVNAALSAFLGEGGIRVAQIVEWDGAVADAHFSDETMRQLAVRAGASGDAVLIPGSDMPGLDLIPALERELGKPVLTANQVTTWHALTLAGIPAVAPDAGVLMSERNPPSGPDG